MKKNIKKYLMILSSLLILGFLIFHFKNAPFFQIEHIKSFVESLGFWGPLVFALIYIIVTIVGISAAAFTILAGVIFGVFNGLLIVVISATISAMIAFYIARTLKDKLFSNKGKKNSNSKIIKNLILKVENSFENNGFLAISILRLSFMPYIPLSYAAGFVNKLKARDFFLATFITNIFGSFVFIYLGNSITQSIPIFLGAIILLVLFMQIPKFIKKKKENTIIKKSI